MKRNGRSTFGVFIGLVNTGYYKNILTGILDFARENDLNLQCFTTGLLTTPSRWGSDDNLLFSLVDRGNIDGLIVITTALEYYIGRDAFPDFLSRFRGIPLTSIGKRIPGVPSFVIDNEKGMLGLLEHLVDRHRYRRLAYISGPLVNTEAAVRLETFKKFLRSRDIAFDPGLVQEGNFTGMSGRQAVQALLEKQAADVDAIIAANDLMAFGAIEELRSRGIPVPKGMRIVGFDDIDTSGDANLTTVKQPLYEQGYQAAAALYRLLRGEECRPLTIMPTETVIRESCGCLSPALAACSVPPPPAGRRDDDEAVGEITRRCAEFSRGGGDRLRKRVEQLHLALRRSLSARDPEPFISAWREFLFSGLGCERQPQCLQLLVSLLRNDVLGRPGSPEEAAFAESLFHRARILSEEEIRREIAAQNIAAEIQEQHLSSIDASLTGVGSLDEQLRIVFSEFPALGIRSCYLSLFEDQHSAQARARLILAYEDCLRIDLPPRGIAFPAVELIPAALFPADRRHNFIVKILSQRGANLGFILMELGDDVRSAGTYDFLWPKLSMVLQLAIFIEKTVNQARDLDRVNLHLAESNRALEEFAFMASHDLQEPLRKILMFGDRLSESGRSALNEEGRNYLAHMRHSAQRLRNMIESLIDYSKIATADNPFAPTDLNLIVAEVVSDLKPRIERSGAGVAVAPLPVVGADAKQMSQLFRNILGNALKFQPPGGRPEVNVFALSPAEDGPPSIVVEDNGIGIDPKDRDKIFIVFQRLNARWEYDGDGIGLAVCKRIMERHGGAITVEGARGRGSRFILTFGSKVPPDVTNADAPGGASRIR